MLSKYALQPRDTAALYAIGKRQASLHENYTWTQFVAHIIHRYPQYRDEFHYLESLAPTDDVPALKQLTEHEVAVIEFAKLEAAGHSESCQPLHEYIQRTQRAE